MSAEGYGDNNGFRNLHEFELYHWLQESLPDHTKICHNFYVYDDRTLIDREIDIGILTDRLFLLIEHKTSFIWAYEARKQIKRIDIPIRGLLPKKRPYINDILVTKESLPPDKKLEMKKEKLYSITSEGEAKEFIEADFPIYSPKKWRSIESEDMEKVMSVLNCKKYKYRQVDRTIFKVFDEVQKRPPSRNGKYKAFSTKERRRRIDLMHTEFEPISYLLSKVFIELEKERLKRPNPGTRLVFNRRRASRKYLARLRPTYWVCAIPSEDEDEANHIQLGFHISKGEWYNDDSKAKPQDHIAIKLAFFKELNEDSFAYLKEKLDADRTTFRRLLSDLAEKDPEFVFHITHQDRYGRKQFPNYHRNSDQIAEDIISYDEPDGTAKPRSTEIAKFIVGDDSFERIFHSEQTAITLLRKEFEKLLPLYYFFINHESETVEIH